MDYSVAICCSGNVLTELLRSNGHILHDIYCDSTPETLVTNYKQQIATQRSKLFLQ
jgi:hypothetical protein